MKFLDAWLELSPVDLVRVAVPLALGLLPVLVPGPDVAWIAAFAMAPIAAIVMLGRAPLALALSWALLWLLLAIRLQRARAPRTPAPPWAGIESAAVGIGLGVVLLALLFAAVARQDLPGPVTRLTSSGIALLGTGLLHLMLRRHAVRAAFGVVAMGFGLQLLVIAAADAEVPAGSRPAALVLLGTALTAALTLRVGESRERFAGSPWTADAHMLHD